MPSVIPPDPAASGQCTDAPIGVRFSADALFHASLCENYARTDRLFAVLMACQFLAGVVIAALVSPWAWRGTAATVHPHVWAAVFVGGMIAALPIRLAITRPGQPATRFTIAVAQMLVSTLLTHLTGGRIETHFHVFGSLAFLALYRDWRVLIVATAVTAGDHFARGALLPTSVYGTAWASPWRSVEHAAWVAFEDVILVIGAVRSTREMRRIAERTAALTESEERTRAIVGSTLDAVITMDHCGVITGWNPQAQGVFGWSAAEAVGRSLSATIVPAERRAAYEAGYRSFLGGGVWPDLGRRLEVQALHKDGRSVPIELTMSPLRTGGTYQFASFARDISERRRHEAELRAATVAAEAASVSKTAFLANMSHEIRTPMTAIVGYADLLLDPSRTPSDRVDALQVIRRNAHHLLGLINDVLDVSKIEAGQMTVERLAVDLPQLVAEVASLCRPRAMEKGLAFRVAFDGPIPRAVRTDPMRLKQILTNLLGNATKFTAAGTVALRVTCDGEGGADRLRFDVTDTGVGLTAEQRGRLFQPFTQADESTTRKFGGTGLGLTVSRRLARLLGGDVTVDSAPGVGSTFTAVVDPGDLTGVEQLTHLAEASVQPVDPPTAGATAAADLPRLDGRRVLLAEDGEDNQMLIALYLRSAGADVTVADNGRIGLDAATAERAAGRPFDVVLTDMQMPELDGYGLARALRDGGFPTPVIALTAHAMSGDRDRCLSAGCTDYLTKPIDRIQLVRMIDRYLSAVGEPTTVVLGVAPRGALLAG